jgi:hypothetical protein
LFIVVVVVVVVAVVAAAAAAALTELYKVNTNHVLNIQWNWDS